MDLNAASDPDADRLTLPYPELPEMRSPADTFDQETEHFLSDAPTWPAFAPVNLATLLEGREHDGDDAGEWWATERRRGLRSWVTGAMALCVGVLAAAALLAPFAGG